MSWEAVRTTWSASLVTAGVVRKLRECCLKAGRSALGALRNAFGISFEAMVVVVDEREARSNVAVSFEVEAETA